MEVYNLERKREYSGYPVYWLGRANNEESLNYLRAIAAATPLDRLSERAVLGIALHDDARVAGMLKNFVSTSSNQRIRSSAVYWLGQVGGEQTFLAGLVRNETEEIKLRRSAAHAIGQSRERGTIPMLQGLYETVKDVEVRQSVISAAGHNIDEQPAIAGQLGVRSIPAVYAFDQGRPVDGFMGAIPESQIKLFVDRLAGADMTAEIEPLLEQAAESLKLGDIGGAHPFHDPSAVVLDRPRADAKPHCDLLVGEALGDQVHDFLLPG